MAVMTEMGDHDADPVQNQIEFRLIDLVPRDCCETERVDLETRLRRLEQSLNDWLREKIAAIESEQSMSVISPLVEVFSGGQQDKARATIGHEVGQEEVILMSTDE